MAYKIVLVDDELLDLQAMEAFIPWSELGYEIVEAVNSGFLALEAMDRQPVDLLITDIHMPNMTGLELARRALEKKSDLRIIFISGHQEFNYVKSAIALNAWSYVLKPVDDQELIGSLVAIRKDLDQEKERQEAEHAYKRLMPIIQKEYWQQLLEGSNDPLHMKMLLDDSGANAIVWPVAVAVLEPDDWSWKLNHYSDSEKKAILTRFRDCVYAKCQEYGIQHVCKMGGQRMALLLERNKGNYAVLVELNDYIQAQFPFTITGGIGGFVHEPVMLHESYLQAISALDYKMFVGKGKWIESSSIPMTEIKDAEHLDIQLDALFAAMKDYNLVGIHDELDALFRLVQNWRSRFSAYNFAMYIFMKLDGFLNSLNEDMFNILDIELKNLDILLQFETIADIHSWLRRRLFQISEQLNQKKLNKNSKLVRDIIDYVRENLQENLTLRHIANHFAFSPNYLGLLFREQTGKPYSEYVVAMRMEKAGELLENPSSKVYEVAALVGYRYLPYFSRQFKETYGMTPNEFRRQG
ncbi:response regulator [Paenibacillaceae bacterium]|nr:response regulator [Paenibacillaceae bacterium]